MGRFGGYYKGEKRKLKRKQLEKKSKKREQQEPWVLPKPEIIRK